LALPAPRHISREALKTKDNGDGMQVAKAWFHRETCLAYVLDALFKPIDRVWLTLARRWTPTVCAKTVVLGRLGEVKVSLACDFSGDTCLRTNLLTKMALDHCSAGAVVEIATDNLASVETIPFMLPGHGFVLLATIRAGASWKLYARKEENLKCSV
jgi:TusA-related sulfurtransferase